MPKNSPFLGANLKVVILSILAATTFWFFNALNKNYSARINYPIFFSFERDSVVIMNPIKDEIILDVSSGGWNLLRKTFLFNITPLTIPLNNPTGTKYLSRETLLPLVIEQLGDLTLNAMVTDTLFFDIDKKVSRKVRIVLDSLDLPLAENFRLTSPIQILPDSVIVTGPKVLINKLPDAYVFSISRQNINQNFDRKVLVNLPDAKKMIASPDEIQVKFEVSEFVVGGRKVNVFTTNFPKNFNVVLSDSTVDVNYLVSKENQDQVLSTDFIIAVDYSQLKKRDSLVVPTIVQFPTIVDRVELAPDTLKIVYGIKKNL
jgi:hypothetical protein